MAEHNVRVRWDEGIGKWRADNNAQPGTDIDAEPGDTVTWHASGTDATISFPTNQVFMQQQLFVNDKQRGTLTVNTSAPDGDHDYTVYCLGGGGHPAGNAQGGVGPHPVIIIERGTQSITEPDPR